MHCSRPSSQPSVHACRGRIASASWNTSTCRRPGRRKGLHIAALLVALELTSGRAHAAPLSESPRSARTPSPSDTPSTAPSAEDSAATPTPSAQDSAATPNAQDSAAAPNAQGSAAAPNAQDSTAPPTADDSAATPTAQDSAATPTDSAATPTAQDSAAATVQDSPGSPETSGSDPSSDAETNTEDRVEGEPDDATRSPPTVVIPGTPPERLSRSQKAGWWTLLGAVAVGSAAGVLAGFAEREEDRALRMATLLDLETGGQLLYADVADEYEAIVRRGTRLDGAAIGLGAVAGAAAAAAATVFIVDAVRRHRGRAAKAARWNSSGFEVHF